jgi:DNA-directed RNA polymerase specialized sigma24 family protein
VSTDGPDHLDYRPRTREDILAFTELVRVHRDRLLTVTKSIIPQLDYADVVDEALLTLFRHWHSVTGDRVAWTTVVAKNGAVNALRKARAVPIGLGHEEPSPQPRPPALKTAATCGKRCSISCGCRLRSKSSSC